MCLTHYVLMRKQLSGLCLSKIDFIYIIECCNHLQAQFHLPPSPLINLVCQFFTLRKECPRVCISSYSGFNIFYINLEVLIHTAIYFSHFIPSICFLNTFIFLPTFQEFGDYAFKGPILQVLNHPD